MSLFQRAEQGFDKLFGYNRKQTETFDYCNKMKNTSIFSRFRLQQQEMFRSFTSFVLPESDNSQSVKNQKMITKKKQRRKI